MNYILCIHSDYTQSRDGTLFVTLASRIPRLLEGRIEHLVGLLNHPYAGSPLYKHEMVRRAARASKARLAWISARVAKACGHGTISTADVPVSSLGRLGHSLAVGIGTPPQMHELMLDTGSDLIWTQCKMWNSTVRQRDPLYDPAKSCFAAVPCNGRLCACVRHARSTPRTARGTSAFTTTRTAAYGSAMATGELASETFTFGVHQKASVRLGFGCGRLSSGNLAGASGVMGISPNTLSLISQLQIPRFSYCLTPFADRKTSRILFGAMAHLSKYKTTGPDPNHFHCEEPKHNDFHLRNPSNDFYFLPLVGIPASSFAIGPDSSDGTFIDSGSTIGSIPVRAMEALKKALVKAAKLPAPKVNHTDVCFQLPDGLSMDAVRRRWCTTSRAARRWCCCGITTSLSRRLGTCAWP